MEVNRREWKSTGGGPRAGELGGANTKFFHLDPETSGIGADGLINHIP